MVGRHLAAVAMGIWIFVGGMSATNAADVGGMPTKAVVVSPPEPVGGWTFNLTPYFWAAGLKGDVKLGPNAPLTKIDLDFIKILDHLRFAFMGTMEARNGRFGIVTDTIYLSLKASATGPAGFVNAQLADKTFIGTFVGAYRAIDQGTWWLDLEAGGRAWAMKVDLDFASVPLGVSRSFSKNKSWIDPIIGIRGRAYLAPNFFVQGYADIGGFGVASKSTWQVAGLLGYQYSPKVSFLAGYRYMAVDYDRNGFVWDVNLSGPIFAASFKLN
jgi:hypothetical protein